MKASTRPALLLSKLPPHHINLRDGERRSILCPDCETWHPLYRRMIKTHCTDRLVRGGATPPCPGSGQRIEFNITVEQWAERLTEFDATAKARRSARQHYKPLPAPAPAVTQMRQPRPTAAAVLPAWRHHTADCTACSPATPCPVAARIVDMYAHLRRQESADRLLPAVVAKRASAEWAKYGEATGDAKRTTAKRSGTAVEERNNSCRIHPAGTVSHYRGPDVPLARTA